MVAGKRAAHPQSHPPSHCSVPRCPRLYRMPVDARRCATLQPVRNTVIAHPTPLPADRLPRGSAASPALYPNHAQAPPPVNCIGTRPPGCHGACRSSHNSATMFSGFPRWPGHRQFIRRVHVGGPFNGGPLRHNGQLCDDATPAPARRPQLHLMVLHCHHLTKYPHSAGTLPGVSHRRIAPGTIPRCSLGGGSGCAARIRAEPNQAGRLFKPPAGPTALRLRTGYALASTASFRFRRMAAGRSNRHTFVLSAIIVKSGTATRPRPRPSCGKFPASACGRVPGGSLYLDVVSGTALHPTNTLRHFWGCLRVA